MGRRFHEFLRLLIAPTAFVRSESAWIGGLRVWECWASLGFRPEPSQSPGEGSGGGGGRKMNWRADPSSSKMVGVTQQDAFEARWKTFRRKFKERIRELYTAE